ncbi:putative aldo/keto reductase [Durotheca rogersii]|uniref:putative aldo/keto reductase n=1 Tax=Durotheca rogersii TaxID=419775 RepID=UPI00221F0543|nr:putative aldo/keto reductase [Durotheca rogersii]KAI5862599.1 putative aldo/keto reductase [Durotheca rogersii]
MPTIVGREVGPIGYGMMGLTWREKPPTDEEAFAAMRAALAAGMTFWNGGEIYGPPERNSLVLLERYFERYPGDADKIVLSIKGGANYATRLMDGSPENTRASIDRCIARLKGRKRIDLFQFARRDPNVPLRETFEVIEKECANVYKPDVQTGKIGGISLSEVRAETIHEAVKVATISAVEVELSLFSTHIFEDGVAAACAKYNIPLIAYSPMGRGLLTGRVQTVADVSGLPSQLAAFPRFQAGNIESNLRLAARVQALAARKGVAPAQLAISWVRRLSSWLPAGSLPATVLPIPGATTPERIRENAVNVDISDDEMREIDAFLKELKVAGERYPQTIPMNT